ncbi:M20 family metallopeptidase [Thermaerobacter sp. FW80]|uniref:M20 family metallopeptidase n=1 Tax=Thermaerobacter sp. FW80 TaxID=2546351 RepID=UPI001FAB033D|nr:M20 family metallopeptidase [Thermaerobacter sp. FW80]
MVPDIASTNDPMDDPMDDPSSADRGEGARGAAPEAAGGEASPAAAAAPWLARWLDGRREAMVRLLEALVNRDSPSDHKPSLDEVATFLEGELTRRGAWVERVRQREAGDHLIARFFPAEGADPAGGRDPAATRDPGGAAAAGDPDDGTAAGRQQAPAAGRRGVLLLGHYDTVWPPGEAARRPFRREGARGYGPGAFDMKGGIVIALAALDALAALARAQAARATAAGAAEAGSAGAAGGTAVVLPPVTLLLTADEETGSRTSRALIEALARQHQAVLVLEPAAGDRLKTARKGVGDFRLVVEGREAHAGNDPGRGVSAVEELARQVLRLHALTDPGRGTTVNVGVVRGGLRPNVVAGRAEAAVDVRVPSMAEARRLEELFRRWEPVHPAARVRLLGSFSRPPMEFTPANRALFRRAKAVGSWLGMTVEGAAVGGASDGNFTSALGIPTLDGLGAVGDGAHAPDEHVDLDALPRRAALLAALVLDLGVRPLDDPSGDPGGDGKAVAP